jgi:alkanesulfonate monooxygenase SsuD/methylene tetrahydromethanopterin reductase-like flavin-dependent oxidoreductase (luciferase family)
MRFGFGLITCQRYPGDPRTDTDMYREALQLAEEAEGLGFDSVWTSEHHFADDAYMPAVLPFSAAIAARTRTVKIGTGLALAPMYNALRLAEDAATIDLISGGRFVLGLGMGWLDWEFEALGLRLADRVKETVQAIETCREAWGQGLVERLGVGVTPKPARASGPPIWVGAGAEPAIRRAARIADGWMAGEPTPEEFNQQLDWLRDELASAGRETGSFAISGYWPVFVWPEAEEAWSIVRPHFHYMEWKYEDAEGAKGRLADLPSPPPLEAKEEEELRSIILCGTPDEVVARIRELRDIAGDDLEFIGRLYFPGMPLETMARSARLFAQEVIPRLRG